jgi:GDPmannose 4,6-dehydratase
MMQQSAPDDFVIATGETHSLGAFVDQAFSTLGLAAQDHVETNPALMRPTDLRVSRADPAHAEARLGWRAGSRMREVVRNMVEAERARTTPRSEQTPTPGDSRPGRA